LSAVAAVEQLPSGARVSGASIRRWIDSTPDQLSARAGIRWIPAEDELGPGRYAVVRRNAQAPAVVLAAYDDSEGVDVLAADDTAESEIDALLAALDAQPVKPEPVGQLTAREREILRLVASGMSNREIAAELVVTERTVGTHLRRVYGKLGVHGRRAAAAWAWSTLPGS
jgi:DNA-binding CsgD family transcriptional regulator